MAEFIHIGRLCQGRFLTSRAQPAPPVWPAVFVNQRLIHVSKRIGFVGAVDWRGLIHCQCFGGMAFYYYGFTANMVRFCALALLASTPKVFRPAGAVSTTASMAAKNSAAEP